MSDIGNTATREDGVKVDNVLVFEWNTGESAYFLVPDTMGNWSVDTYAGTFGIAYLASGYKPEVHGPYTLSGGPKPIDPPPSSGATPYVPSTDFNWS